MPFFDDNWKQTPHNSKNQFNNMITKSIILPDSILGLYCKDRLADEKIPNLDRLINSVKKYIELNFNNLQEMINLVEDKNTLCIHIRSGDRGNVTQNFINTIKKNINNYDKIILFGGIHSDTRFGTEIQNKTYFMNSINSILGISNNIFISIAHPDEHISIMSKASNLLLHKGTFSTILSLINKNNLFITDEFTTSKCKNWRDLNIQYTYLSF